MLDLQQLHISSELVLVIHKLNRFFVFTFDSDTTIFYRYSD
jgi:hypothetical protein